MLNKLIFYVFELLFNQTLTYNNSNMCHTKEVMNLKDSLTSRSHKLNRSERYTHQHAHVPLSPRPHRNPKWLIIILSLLIIVALAGLVYGIYRLSQFDVHLNLKADRASFHQPDTQTVQIDTLSLDFSQNYMHADCIDGYQGFNIGETRKDIEKQYGPPQREVQIANNKAASYGDMAVTYNEQDKINHVYVTPQNVTTSDFIAFHQTPNITDGDIWYYDQSRDNPYTIKVYTSGNQIMAIENIPQINDTL